MAEWEREFSLNELSRLLGRSKPYFVRLASQGILPYRVGKGAQGQTSSRVNVRDLYDGGHLNLPHLFDAWEPTWDFLVAEQLLRCYAGHPIKTNTRCILGLFHHPHLQGPAYTCLGCYHKYLKSLPCHYCGEHSDRMQLEHKTPLSVGGAFGLENVLPSCQPCNMDKLQRTYDEYREYIIQRFFLVAKFRQEVGIDKATDLIVQPTLWG